ncbi:hypothetical protein GM658_19330 [Pseudoduganella eburnea]|uniref:Glycosyltransferase RgtA/B/C/D-like domain-containing protein n=1 Tax=Massilia eburnea TaxID=1776165 RepID=A0A6L6QL04_9BURK|nr:glycosyltransferase family 39 protein [Massilia eburnea]MTW12764.1 hypothetical protein [Massilia eburnea]
MQQLSSAPSHGASDHNHAAIARRPQFADRHIPMALAMLGLAQVLMWGIAAWLGYSSTELDSAEQLSWATGLELGYWKHPPMPSWIMHGALMLFKPSIVLPLVMVQTGIVIALGLTWRLAREILPPRQAALSVLITSLVLYHNAGADSFNHNTVLLPFQAAATLAFFLALRHSSLRWWLAAGLFGGLAMLVKYVAAIHFAGLLLYLLLDRSTHLRRNFVGMLLGALVFALVLSPHVYWLHANGYPPMQYAHSVMIPLTGPASAFASVGQFIETQVFRLVPLLPLLIYIVRQRRAAPAHDDVEMVVSRRDKLFVWVAGAAPLLVTIAFSLLSGSKLEARWGANAFLLTGMVAIVAIRPHLTAERLKNIMGVTLLAHVVLCAGLVAGKSVVAKHFDRRTRANFPAAELAQEAERTWRKHTNAPLRLVATDIWLGGNLRAAGLPGVAVLIDGDYTKSPWVTQEQVHACGMLILDDTISNGRAGVANPEQLHTLMDSAEAAGSMTLNWGSAKQERRTVHWAYLPPHDAAHCTQAG